MATDSSASGSSGNQSSAPGGGAQTSTTVPVATGAVDVNQGSNATQAQKNTAQTNANLMAQYGAGNYDIQADGTVVPKASSSVGIVTSNQSVANMNNNINTLDTAKTNLTASINNQNINNQQNNGGNANTSTQNNTSTNNSNNSGGSSGGSNNNGSSTNDGTGTGYTTVTDSQGNQYQIAPGTDMGMVNAQIQDFNTAVSTVQGLQNTVNSYNTYNVNTDPDAVQAVNDIKSSYDTLIQQMQQKNAYLIGVANESGARSGMAGSLMESMYNSDVLQNANQHVATLQQQELEAINKSNQAYKDGNVKALNDAQTQLKDATAQKQTALQDLQKTINDQIAANAAQAKQDAADAKAQSTLDFETSAKDAQTVLNNLTAAGLTDPTDPEYISAIKAAAAADGISDWTKLQGAIGQLAPTAGKAGLAVQNIVSTINDRNAKTASDIAKANQTIQLNNGKILSLDLSGMPSAPIQTEATNLGKTIASSKAYVSLANNASVLQQLKALQNVQGSAAQEEALGKFASTISATGTGVARLINYVQNNFGSKAAQTINSGLQYLEDNKTIPANVYSNMIDAVQADYTAQQSSFANSVQGQLNIFANINSVSPDAMNKAFGPLLDPTNASTPTTVTMTGPKGTYTVPADKVSIMQKNGYTIKQ